MWWLLTMISWAGSPCDYTTPLADAIDASDSAWVAASLAPVRSQVGNLQPVLVLKGKADDVIRGQQPMIVLKRKDLTCSRALIGHSERNTDALRTGLARFSSPTGLDAATLADLEVDTWAAYRWDMADTTALQEPVTMVGTEYTGPALKRGTRTVQFAAQPPERGRWIRPLGNGYGKLIVSEWSLHDGACPTQTHLLVTLRTAEGMMPLLMKNVESERPLGCVNPKASRSDCVGLWGNGLVNDVHLGGECPDDAVQVTANGRPWCVNIDSCAAVPFK